MKVRTLNRKLDDQKDAFHSEYEENLSERKKTENNNSELIKTLNETKKELVRSK